MKSKNKITTVHQFYKNIPKSWRIEKLSNKVVIKGRIGWKGLKVSEYVNSGPYIITGIDIANDTVNWDQCSKVTQERYEESPEIMLKENDILMTKDGTIGKLAYIQDLSFVATVAAHIHVIRIKSDDLLPRFLFYFFKTKNFTNLVNSRIEGSVVPSILQRDINELEILIPSIREQQFISDQLLSLDKKIRILVKQNQILENIIQSIFKSWFIDFDGQTEFVDSELGEIPKEWSIGTLGEICEIVMGQSPPGKTYNKEEVGIPFYQGVTDFGFRFPSRRVFCTVPKRFAEENDVLFSVRAPVGSLNIANEYCCIGRGLASIRLKENHGPYLYYLLNSTTREWEKFEAEGTIFGSVTKDDVHDFQIIKPPTNLIKKFNSFTDIIYKTTWDANKEIHELEKIRDLLLPKLMSGEIRV